MRRSDEVFPSRIDAWFVVAIAIGIGISLGLGICHLPQPAGWIGIGTGVFVAVLCAALAFPCRYVLERDALAVRAGLIRFRLPYDQIATVEPSRNPLSAPALSLRRVKITLHNARRVLISPRERERFISQLKKRAAEAKQASG